MALYKALYGRRYRCPIGWFEKGEARLLGTDLVQNALEKVKVIQDRLRTTQSRQKSYADWKVLYHVGEVAYELTLPPSLAGVHPLFHVSMLRKYYSDPSEVLDLSSVQLDKDLSYVEEPMAILDRTPDATVFRANIFTLFNLVFGDVLGGGGVDEFERVGGG
ncbi:uncharacterized protein [Nicotiana sylvestris]|uniref:uncharacterized protein n=1 Tax=Nicotiana sylvestris TaxID=4096 RepID=UPI00388C481E